MAAHRADYAQLIEQGYCLVPSILPEPLRERLRLVTDTLPARAALELLLTRYLDAVWANRAFMLMVFTTPKREQAVFEEIWAEFGKQGLYLYTMLQERSERKELRAEIAAAATDVIATSTGGFLGDAQQSTLHVFTSNVIKTDAIMKQ